MLANTRRRSLIHRTGVPQMVLSVLASNCTVTEPTQPSAPAPTTANDNAGDADCLSILDGPCDLENPQCQVQLFSLVGCAMGAPAGAIEPPAVRIIPPADPLQQDYPEEDGIWQHAASVLGLVPLDAGGAIDDGEAPPVPVAYYSRRQQQVTLQMDIGVNEGLARLALAHEYVHAIQDQIVGLTRLFADALEDEITPTSDAIASISAATEGEAVHYSTVALLYLQGEQPSLFPWGGYHAELLTDIREAVLRSPDKLHDALVLFPYAFGAKAVGDRWLQGESWPHLSHVPTTLVHWLEPAAAVTVPWCRAPDDEWELTAVERFGTAGIYALLTAWGGTAEQAFSQAARWRGGFVGAFEHRLRLHSPAVIWYVDWDSDETEKTFTEFVRALAPSSVVSESSGTVTILVASADQSARDRWVSSVSEACFRVD
jgi:hypothetical protein